MAKKTGRQKEGVLLQSRHDHVH